MTRETAKARVKEFWGYYMADNYEALCFEDNGVQWQIYLVDDETFTICVEGYSEDHNEWNCLNDVADIIYEFNN